MPIPAGYTQLTTGFWRKDSDLSGPYAWTGAAFYLISTGVAGSGVPADYTQHPSGFWFKTADGSGPYSYDGTDFWLAGNGGPSGAITVATVNVTSAINMSNGSTFNLYNTADQTTNYERLRASFSSNVALISAEFGGTGTSREMRIGSASTAGANPVHYFRTNAASSPALGLIGGTWGGATFATVTGTYSASSVSQTAFSIAPTINQSGTAGYTALDVNPTETATGSGTKLLQRWAVGGTALGLLNNAGTFIATNSAVSSSGVFGFSSSGLSTGLDVVLARDATNVLAMRNGTNAQTFRVYNTYTDGSNYERVSSTWSGSIFYLVTEQAGTGTARSMAIGTTGVASLSFLTSNSSRWQISSAGHFLATTDNSSDIGASGANRPRNIYAAQYLTANIVRTPGILVSALPAAGTAGNGARAFVTDANATTYASIVAGGGANTVPVYSDGTNWRIG